MALYPSLPDTATIRVLVLHPGSEQEELSASFQLVHLDSPCCEYEAISYAWGPEVFPCRIEIDGQRHEITQTLFDAFVRLRFPDRERVLWADAVCINQSSIDEKNHQVRLMKRIYSQCARGIIYLGPQADGSELVADFIQYLEDWVKDNSPTGDTNGVTRAMLLDTEAFAGVARADDVRWAATKALLSRPYFRRLWILQEYALPKRIVAICGHWALNGFSLHSFIYLFDNFLEVATILGGDPSTNNGDLFRTIRIWGYNAFMRPAVGHYVDSLEVDGDRRAILDDSLRMYRLMLGVEYCDVSDPRDAFYGLLGLACDLDDDPSLLPDYNKSLMEVRNDFYAFFFRQGLGLRILQDARNHFSRDVSQPSWMNIYGGKRVKIRSAQLSMPGNEANLERLKASSVAQLSNTEVAVRGWMLDKIRCQTESRYHHQDNMFLTEVFEVLRDVFSSIKGIEIHDWTSLESHKSPDGEDFKHMVFRILCQDRPNDNDNDDYPDGGAFFDVGVAYIDNMAGKNGIPSVPDECFYLSVIESQLTQAMTDVWNRLWQSDGARFGATEYGYFGLFPPNSMPGDQIFMIDGTLKTFLVRPHQETDTHLWLGEIYVHAFAEHIQNILSCGTSETIILR